MAAWSDGYVTDIQYTGQYYPEMAPGYLAFACLRQGVRPPAMGPGSTYLELGCGQGYGLALMAAANPAMQFHGVDFNPAQIANANRLAAEAGLSNVAFEDLSFAQMLELPEGRLPRCDVIALHGVYSWVGAENRAAIVRIIDRLLKPGGLVYVSYNCLPGWSANAALQHLIQEHAAQAKGDTGARIVEALNTARQMQDGAARYFDSAPALKARVDEALKRPPEYLAHEYLNAGSAPLYSADVARQMDGARLSLAASANLADDMIHLAAPRPLQAMIQAATDRTWRETLLDYASNKIFRRDVFVRGRNSLSAREREEALDATQLTLLVPADQVTFESSVPLGALTGDPKVYRPIVEALADGPRSIGELTRLPGLAGMADGVATQALLLLIGRRQIHPLASAAGEANAAAFNRAALARMPFNEAPNHLAAPRAGTAVQLDFDEMATVRALLDGEDDNAAMARKGWEILSATNRRLRKDNTLLHDQAANEAELVARIGRFKTDKLPLLRSLGVV